MSHGGGGRGEGKGERKTYLRSLKSREVTVVDIDVVVVSHVVILSVVIIIAIDDAGGVHTTDIISVTVDLNKAMEPNVEESKEVRHANERLKIDPKDKTERSCDGNEDQGDGPVGIHPLLQQVMLALMTMTFEEFQRGEAEHVVGNAIDVEHEMCDTGPV
jgi:hypothetical protein